MGKQNLYEDELRMMAGKNPVSGGGLPYVTPTKPKTENPTTEKPANGNGDQKPANQNNPKNINPKGIVQPQYQPQAAATPAAETKQAAAPSLQATAQSSVQVNPIVTQAMQTLQNLQTNKPEGYTSKYQPQMDALLNQIQNRGNFTWDFNGDELFKSYADLYTQNGRQASMDAMGQAAALTGGYGNSYSQQVGNQAYDEYLRGLYDKGMEFRNAAYEEWLQEGQDLYNQYGLLQNADATDYSRYRDTYEDWLNDRNFYETQRQFNESLDWDKMSAQQKYAAEYAMQILANGQMPTAEMLQAAGLSAEDAQKMMAQIVASGGGTGGKKSAPILAQYGDDLWEVNEDGTLKKDANGNYIRADKSKITQYYDAGKVKNWKDQTALTKQNVSTAMNNVLTNADYWSQLGKNADKEYWQKIVDEYNKKNK